VDSLGEFECPAASARLVRNGFVRLGEALKEIQTAR
jgi:hypothetical protein